MAKPKKAVGLGASMSTVRGVGATASIEIGASAGGSMVGAAGVCAVQAVATSIPFDSVDEGTSFGRSSGLAMLAWWSVPVVVLLPSVGVTVGQGSGTGVAPSADEIVAIGARAVGAAAVAGLD